MDEDQKVSREVAEADFHRFCDMMDLDVDPRGMDDEDRKSFESAKRRLVDAIIEGHLVIDEKGQPVYTPRRGSDVTPITFAEPTGASYMAMDTKKKNHDVAKLFATMADMTGQPIQRFAKMQNRDLKICQAVALLFLG